MSVATEESSCSSLNSMRADELRILAGEIIKVPLLVQALSVSNAVVAACVPSLVHAARAVASSDYTDTYA